MNTLFQTETESLLTIRPLHFVVYGTPKPQGSTRAFMPRGWTRPVITTDNKALKPWRQQITGEAMAQNVQKLDEAAVSITLDFFFAKPKSAGRKRTAPSVKPDIDKLSRGVLDSLTGVLFRDDAQVVELTARKHYGDPERVEITMQALS